MKKENLRRLVLQVESNGDIFPSPCGCGCGEPVRYGINGVTRFVNRQHVLWAKDYKSMSAAASSKRLDDNISIEKFREAIKKIRLEKGWTVAEISIRGGQQAGWLNSYLYNPKYKTIGKETATAFFRRLSGMSEKPSKFQLRNYSVSIRNTDQAIKDIDAKRSHKKTLK